MKKKTDVESRLETSVIDIVEGQMPTEIRFCDLPDKLQRHFVDVMRREIEMSKQVN